MKKTILCIDDIETNLFIIQSVIEDMASDLYDIILATSANEGLSILLKQKIDLVLMDIMMPYINGLEATQMIKSNKKTKEIPVIFVTAKNDDKTIDECYKVGGDDYVNKPFNHYELLARISFHLESKEKGRLLQKEKEYTQNILDLQENFILVSSGTEDITANKALLNFYDVENVAELRKKHTSVCETFMMDEDYFNLNKIDDQSIWISEVIRLSEDEDVLVKIKKQNTEYIFNVKATSFKAHYIVTFTDITQVSQLALEYKREASYDALTQIYNRNMFHRLMDRRISIAKDRGSSFVLVLLDIDHFKSVNDIHGHLVGDDVLINLAALIKEKTRDRDIFARWGGEEFMLVFDSSLEAGIRIANKVRESIAAHAFDVVGNITCSFGVTEFREMDSLDDMIKRADDALYSAKANGRNQVRKFSQ